VRVLSPFQGNALNSDSDSQGVALGWIMMAFQAIQRGTNTNFVNIITRRLTGGFCTFPDSGYRA
jgi:hypothetical protein